MAQINPTVGDLDGNARLVLEYARKAEQAKADLVAFPEMVITGYPPLDLLPPRETRRPAGERKPEQEDFVRLNKQHVLDLAKEIGSITAIVGFVDYDDVNLFNAAAVISRGSVKSIVYKTLLPTYDVFDEQRYFTSALVNKPVTLEIEGQKVSVGTSICEDIWDEEVGYGVKVVDALGEQGARLIVNLNASPFHNKIRDIRLRILKRKAVRLSVPIFYVNQVWETVRGRFGHRRRRFEGVRCTRGSRAPDEPRSSDVRRPRSRREGLFWENRLQTRARGP
jgi:NAD+ synthase (glutamine-hydrolysing)